MPKRLALLALTLPFWQSIGIPRSPRHAPGGPVRAYLLRTAEGSRHRFSRKTSCRSRPRLRPCTFILLSRFSPAKPMRTLVAILLLPAVLAAGDFAPDAKAVRRHGPGYRYPQAGGIVL